MPVFSAGSDPARMAYGIAMVLAHAIPTPTIEKNSSHLLWIGATDMSAAAPHTTHRLWVALRPSALANGRTQVRPHVAGRRARRGRDSRPPAHLHRRSTRSDHSDDEESGHQEPGLHAGSNRQYV